MGWWRRIRAALVMGVTWAIAFALAGGVVARIPGFFSDLPFPILFAPLGFATGVLFSGILAAAARRRGFDRLSLPGFAAWGAASGLLLTGLFAAGGFFQGANVLTDALVFGSTLTAATAVSAAGTLALARRAERQALSDPGDGVSVGPGTKKES